MNTILTIKICNIAMRQPLHIKCRNCITVGKQISPSSEFSILSIQDGGATEEAQLRAKYILQAIFKNI